MKKEQNMQDELNKLVHDLMNPLTVIIGYAQLMSSRIDLPEDALPQAKDIYQQALEAAFIADKLKKWVAAGESGNLGYVVVLDPEDDIFKEIKGILGNGVAFHYAKDIKDAVNFILSNQVESVVVDLDVIDLDEALVQLNSAKPGLYIVIVTKREELAEKLQSMGYVVLVKPLQRQDVLTCFI